MFGKSYVYTYIDSIYMVCAEVATVVSRSIMYVSSGDGMTRGRSRAAAVISTTSIWRASYLYLDRR